MDIIRSLNAKTALEHLIFLTGHSIIEVCRTLHITPQQFSDWIKQRRPIPADRLRQLAVHFGVADSVLAEDSRFARRISALSAVELEQLVVENRLKICSDAQEQSALQFRVQELEAERERQRRIARLASLLETGDSATLSRVDAFLDDMEKH